MENKSYKDLIVWQKAVDLVVEIYLLTDKFPKQELYGLISQMRRAAISIPSNIAEGRYRSSRKEYKNFLTIAFSSGGELETQIEICKRLPHLKRFTYDKIDHLLIEIMKMLNSLIHKLSYDV